LTIFNTHQSKLASNKIVRTTKTSGSIATREITTGRIAVAIVKASTLLTKHSFSKRKTSNKNKILSRAFMFNPIKVGFNISQNDSNANITATHIARPSSR